MEDLKRRLSHLSPAKRALVEKMLKKKGIDIPAAAISKRDTQYQESLPLSVAQHRLWILEQLTPGTSNHNNPFAYRIKGEINPGILERSINEIIQRHEALRTTFAMRGEEPAQVISQSLFIPIKIKYLQNQPEQLKEAELPGILKEESLHPFDITRGPLIRVLLVILDPEISILLVVIHHIVSDGWSKIVFIRELLQLYDAFNRGQSSPLPELSIQYADFSVWQHQQIKTGRLHEQLSYWKTQLQGCSILDFPRDHPRPPIQTFNGNRHSFTIEEGIIVKLKELALGSEATIFMVLLTAFDVFLYRYTHQTDIVVGSPISGRTRKEIEELIGFFVNILPLRIEVVGELSFIDLLKRVKETVLDGFAHQEVPFEKMVEIIQPDRDTRWPPIVQVIFQLRNLQGLNVIPCFGDFQHFPFDTGIAAYDLILEAEEREGKLCCFFDYNSDLFEPISVERMAGHFKILISSISQDSEMVTARIPLLTENEYHQLLEEWNNTTVSYPQQCIHTLFEMQAAINPDTAALVFKDNVLTYEELNSWSQQLSWQLKEKGVGVDTIAAIMAERSLEMVIGIWSILKAGGAYLPIDPEYPEERISYMLKDSGAKILLKKNDFTPEAFNNRPKGTSSHLHLQPAPHTSLAYIMYTSGSTGKPKGVMITHRNVVNLLKWFGETYDLQPGIHVLQLTDYTFDPSVEDILGTLLHSGVLYVVEKNIVCDSEAFHRYIQKHQIHFIHFVPNGLEELLGSEKPDNLDFVICGGERLEESIKDRIIGYGYKLYNHYGPTEITVDALVSTCGKGRVTIGTPIANVRCYIVNHYNMLMPIGAPGELCIAGAGLARGYLNKPEMTFEKFCLRRPGGGLSAKGDMCRLQVQVKKWKTSSETIPPLIGWVRRTPAPPGPPRKNVSLEGPHNDHLQPCNHASMQYHSLSPQYPITPLPHSPLYRTGDLARWLPDGNIEFLGRLDDQVKISGFRIEPGEIENTLKTHSAIKDAKILEKEYNPGDRRLVAYIILNKGKELGTRDLREFLEKKLPHFMIPCAFVKLEQFPLTPNNKVDIRTLIELDISNPGLENTFVLPRTPIEKAIAEIWCHVLKISSLGVIDVYHSFFELGGNSLLAVHVISRLQRILGVNLPVIALFETKTIADLAVRVIASLQGNRSPMDLMIKSVSRERKLPLSFSQERLWFLDHYQPGHAVYNIPLWVRLLGLLDESALRYSLNQISQRHEVLRTTFHQEHGEPFQVINPVKTSNVELPMIDLSHLPGIQQEEELYELVYREVNRSFDLSNGLLWRAILLRKAKDHHLLLVTVHHIVFDGWSMDIFLEELGSFYESFTKAATHSPPLADLPYQFADFAVWQRNWFQEHEETLNLQLSYWKEQLKDVPAFLSFPTDKPRPHVQTFNGANFHFLVPQNLFGALKELSNSEGVTLFMALLAVFKLLLFRYSGISDTVVGTPMANRNFPGLENLIGFFVNTLVLRTSLDGNPGFKELLNRVRNVCLEAYRNQDYPFEQLVGKLQPERNLSYSPLFQVMFAFQVSMPKTYEFSGITMVRDEIHTTAAKFDFTMFIEETPDELRGRIAYNTDLFYSEAIQRISQHFLVLLNSAVKDPVQPISTLPILTETEQRLLFYEWSNTQRDYPINRCIHHLIEDRVTQWPDAAVIVWRDQVLTYRELNHRGNRVADDLISKGVRIGDIVGIYLERSLEMVIALLGVLKSGGAYLPVDVNYPEDRINYMLADSAAKILLTTRNYSNEIKFEKEIIYISDVINHGPTPHHLHLSPASTASLAYVMYTSGSAGTPKGVLVSHGAVVRLLFGLDDVDLDGKPVILQMAPFSFDASIFELWGPLVHGGRCVLYPGSNITIKELAKVLQNHYIQVLWLTAALFNTIMDETPEILASIQQLLIGGEALSVSHVRLGLTHLTHTQIINGYGPTEGTTFTCCYLIPPGLPANISSIPIGRPIYNTRVYILDNNKQPVPIGVAGELCITGDGLARGYLNNPELTEESFNQTFLQGTMRKAPSAKRLPPGLRRQKIYKTGDLARWLSGGDIEFLGRIDHQVKISGFRIEPGEIESTLRTHAAVNDVIVLAKEYKPGDRRLVAYIIFNRGNIFESRELREFLGQKLPSFMIPSVFIKLERFPLGPSGKVDYRALPLPRPAAELSGREYKAPRDEVEIKLVQIWEKLLGVKPISISDDFFQLGGYSLSAIRMFYHIEKKLGHEIGVSALFHAPTIEKLAEMIRSARVEESSLVLLRPGGTKSPFFFMHHLEGGILDYRELANLVDIEHPVYGIQVKMHEGKPLEYTDIKEAAWYYAKVMKTVVKNGPYMLGGHSFGGIVALETARMLIEQGHRVVLLAIIDTRAPGTRWLSKKETRGYYLRTYWERLKFHTRRLFALKGRKRWQYFLLKTNVVLERLQRRWKRFIRRIKKGRKPGPFNVVRDFKISKLLADSGLISQGYPGKVTLFKASISLPLYEREDYGWKKYARDGVEVYEIQGEHGNLLKEPYAVELAEKLNRCIHELLEDY